MGCPTWQRSKILPANEEGVKIPKEGSKRFWLFFADNYGSVSMARTMHTIQHSDDDVKPCQQVPPVYQTGEQRHPVEKFDKIEPQRRPAGTTFRGLEMSFSSMSQFHQRISFHHTQGSKPSLRFLWACFRWFEPGRSMRKYLVQTRYLSCFLFFSQDELCTFCQLRGD